VCEIAQKLTGEVIRQTARGVAGQVRRHDLPFYAAGLTFYAAIAVVPLLLVAWFVTSLVLGDEGPLDPPRPTGFAGERPRPLREVEREENGDQRRHDRGVHDAPDAALLPDRPAAQGVG
jgi:hypothetical protein